MKKSLLVAASLLTTVMSFGAGYQLNLQGLRQLAMGGSGTAYPWDASTIFYNPGGLSRLDGIQAYGSVQFVMPSVEYAQTVGNYTARTSPQTFTTFNVYVGGPIKYESKWGLGLGVYTPFGSGITWPDDWAGNQMTQSIKLQSIFVQPTVSYRINDLLSVGAGFVYANGSVDFRQALPLQNQFGTSGGADLQGNGNGFGFNAGVQIKVSKKLQFGVTYRSQVNLKVNNGDAYFSVPSSLTGYFPNTHFSSTLPLPQVISVGAAYKPIRHLTVQADLEYVGWHSYDSLRFDYAQQTSELQNTHLPRKYNNALAIRVGGNYNLFDNKLSVMAGFAYDPTPVPDGVVTPDLPDANRLVLTCGLAYRPVERLCIMAALEYTTSAKRTGSYDYEGFSGQYQTKAITPGIGLTYNFYSKN